MSLINRSALERHQAWLYLAAILIGLIVGSGFPQVGRVFEQLLWPTLVLLLYATFLQMPLVRLKPALRDRRFTAAMLLGNFIVLPALVWGMVELFGFGATTRLGVLLVLLVPCTDWFITFSQLGKGDAPRAVAATPLNLALQLLLLPVYLWLMADAASLAGWSMNNLLPAALIVLAPLVAAVVTEMGIDRHPKFEQVRRVAARGPVPLLGLTVFLIAAAHASAVAEAAIQLAGVVPAFVLFLVLAALVAKSLARLFDLPASQGRTLAFSFGTRNSFVVLPLALALPGGWETTALVIVTQSLVELFGMVVYLWAVPGRLFPD